MGERRGPGRRQSGFKQEARRPARIQPGNARALLQGRKPAEGRMTRKAHVTRIHIASEQDALSRKSPESRNYIRVRSPEIVHGVEVGTKSENVRGRFSEPDLHDFQEDPELRARAFGRRHKLSA